MQIFQCDNCGHSVYFDNTVCLKCHNLLGFDSKNLKMVSLQLNPDQKFTETTTGKGYRFCKNQALDVCNWVISDEVSEQYCIACSLNRIIPDITKKEYYDRWKKIESAKHRLIYALLRWDLPIISKAVDYEKGLAFNFKSDSTMTDGFRVMTGHANGLITMNIAEADDVEREMARNSMDEVYRTVLGHFRHEIGHYYWERLIWGTDNLDAFRSNFGDETYSYQEALNHYYQHGAPANWNQNFISAYATMHPWESWAETWAHYMHIVDTLETAYFYGLSINPKVHESISVKSAKITENAYYCKNFDTIFDQWLPLSFMMNSINRSMGLQDLYPFVINLNVKEKLRFIHNVIHEAKLD
ncbi:zinc-binding metallopeptidase family protein [Cognataquiflexum rubidum]|uniref:zinc-binding metallopeptidase family protein n=1 Tax=Cognataquiflexum rubidum TaxID=2922273 RepID=UPI001F138CF9|nr:putative zinc-binding metallopeptidase [Cognataquiflexum rubidum]MCH6236725.1 putative zinc-binding peptidase [Cognataquiflexum rubidum]